MREYIWGVLAHSRTHARARTRKIDDVIKKSENRDNQKKSMTSSKNQKIGKIRKIRKINDVIKKSENRENQKNR